MNTVGLLALSLFLSVSRVYSQTFLRTGYQAAPGFCCNSQPGPKVLVTPNNLKVVIDESPNYELIATPNFYNQGLDNVCHTYFPMGDNTYFRCTTLTFSNRTILPQFSILGELTGYPGVGRFQGLAPKSGSATLCYEEAFLGSPCPGVRVYYRKYVAGSCNVLRDQIGDGSDFRHGDANTTCISDYCLNQIVSIANSQNFCGSDFVLYPNKLNKHCVTRLNGMSCVNAEKVSPQDSISLPDTGSSCQTLFY